MTLDVANDTYLIPPEPTVVTTQLPEPVLWLPHIMHNLYCTDILHNFKTDMQILRFPLILEPNP